MKIIFLFFKILKRGRIFCFFFFYKFLRRSKDIVFNPIPADQNSGENNHSTMAGKSRPKPLSVYLYIPNIIGKLFLFQIFVWTLSLVIFIYLFVKFDVLENRNDELESWTEFYVCLSRFVESKSSMWACCCVILVVIPKFWHLFIDFFLFSETMFILFFVLFVILFWCRFC